MREGFEPLRPYFLAATGLFLVLGFWLLRWEERKACEPGRACKLERMTGFEAIVVLPADDREGS